MAKMWHFYGTTPGGCHIPFLSQAGFRVNWSRSERDSWLHRKTQPKPSHFPTTTPGGGGSRPGIHTKSAHFPYKPPRGGPLHAPPGPPTARNQLVSLATHGKSANMF